MCPYEQPLAAFGTMRYTAAPVRRSATAPDLAALGTFRYTAAVIHILNETGHPWVGTLLARLRDKAVQQDRAQFRAALGELGRIIGFEIGATLPAAARPVFTPLGVAEERAFTTPPVLATVLRAGLPFFEGLQAVLPHADAMFFGAARQEGGELSRDGALPIQCGYASWRPVAGRTLIWADSMLATGSTLLHLQRQLLARSAPPARVIVAGVIAYRPTLAKLAHELNAEVWCVAADDTLNEHGYIVPGLGDAGDLAYGAREG
jgi:uracil phosphoribosyltransferase